MARGFRDWLFGGESAPKVFQTFNSLLGGITRKTNATLVGPSKQLVGEFPELDFERAYQYYHHWPHVKTAVDVMHQKLRGSGMEIKSNNEYFNVFIEKWWDVANAEKKLSQFIYSLFITGSAILELQYTPDGRIGNVEQIPMQTIHRLFRDQYGNELKLIQIVDGVFKELDPQYFIHHTINNPDRQAFGKSVFYTLASPRPIAGAVDPITGEPINPERNTVALLDAQAQIQNAQVEIVKKMAKPRLIVGANGMQKEQMKEIQAEMSDPNNDQYIWIFDKPIQSAELQIQSQGKFDEYTINVDGMIDIALLFASNVIKNPQGFSYAGGQTPLDVLDQRMMDLQGELIEIIKDRLLKPLAESWGFRDFDAMEVKISFTPTMKRLTMDDIHLLDKEAVSKKEIRELYKKLNIALDDQLYDEEQKELKQDKQDQKNIQMQGAINGVPQDNNGKDPFKTPEPAGDKPNEGGDGEGSVKAPKAPKVQQAKPEFDRPKPTPTKTPRPDKSGETLIANEVSTIISEIDRIITERLNEKLSALERVPLPPRAGSPINSSSDLYVSQGLDDEGEKPQITDPAVRDAYGLDKDDSETPPTDPSKMAHAGDKAGLMSADNTNGRFTNNNQTPQPPIVSEEEYRQHLQRNTKGDAYQGGTGDDGITSDSDGSFKDPYDLNNDMERTPETGNTALKNPHPRPNQDPMVEDDVLNTPQPFQDSGGSQGFPDNTKKQVLGSPDDDESPIAPSEGFEPDNDEEETKKKINSQNLKKKTIEAVNPNSPDKKLNRDLKVGEDPMTSGIIEEDEEDEYKQQARLDDHPLQQPSANKGNINGIDPNRQNQNNTSQELPSSIANNNNDNTELVPPYDKTSQTVGDNNQARLQNEELTGKPQDTLKPNKGIFDNSGLNMKPDYQQVTQDDYMRKVQDGSDPLEKKGDPLEDGMIIKPEETRQNDGTQQITNNQPSNNDPTDSGIDEEQVDPNVLHYDPEIGRMVTDLTDEQGEPVPDLRFDQTPSSDEDQPEVELKYEIVTKDEYNQHLNAQQPSATQDNPLDPVEKDESGNPMELNTVDSQPKLDVDNSAGDNTPPSKPQPKKSEKPSEKKTNPRGKSDDKKPKSSKKSEVPKKDNSQKSDSHKSETKDKPTKDDVKDLPDTKGDVEEIIKREHDLIEKGVPEDEVHDILLEEFGDKANDYKKEKKNGEEK